LAAGGPAVSALRTAGRSRAPGYRRNSYSGIPMEKKGGRPMRICRYSLILLGVLSPAAAQNYEAGGAAGFGFYRSAAISGPGGAGSAGFGSRFALSAVAGKALAGHFAV